MSTNLSLTCVPPLSTRATSACGRGAGQQVLRDFDQLQPPFGPGVRETLASERGRVNRKSGCEISARHKPSQAACWAVKPCATNAIYAARAASATVTRGPPICVHV